MMFKIWCAQPAHDFTLHDEVRARLYQEEHGNHLRQLCSGCEEHSHCGHQRLDPNDFVLRVFGQVVLEAGPKQSHLRAS